MGHRRWTGWRPLLVVGTATGLLAGALPAVLQPAQAATVLGSLAIDPPTGQDTTPMSVTTVTTGTSKGCPVAAPNIQLTVTGPGGWASGVTAIGNTSAGVSTSEEFTLPLADSFAGLAAANSIPVLAGRYQLTMSCQNSLGTTQGGTFTGVLWFTDAGHYRTTDPATSPPSPTPSASAGPTPDTTASSSPSPAPSPTPTAPVLGGLAFSPAVGTGSPGFADTVSSAAAKGCPVGSAKVRATAVGPGEWAQGVDLGAASEATPGAEEQVAIALTGLPIVAGRYQVTVACTNPLGTSTLGVFTAPLWYVDETHYQSTDPATSQVTTQLTVDTDPRDRVELGRPLTVRSAVTPGGAAGSVTFRETQAGATTDLGSSPLTSGQASLTRSDLPFGLHVWSAKFVPSDTRAYAESLSGEVTTVVALPVPPLPPAAATVSGTPRVGSRLICQGTFRNAASTSYQWWRDGTAIPGATAATHPVMAADKGHRLRCQIKATNAGGTTRRTSVPLAVTR